ncbi:MAG: hypothetical protein FJ264_09625 [Planctomycetes bacterium]|nr:hypothetical protein [Planctomycetota bacterium]
MHEPIDIKTRELAVSEQDKNIVLTAGAGTGKTTILVQRMLHILLAHKSLQSVESPILKIVALTFTEKAASDMKIRLMEELEKIAAAIKGACNQEEQQNADTFIARLQTTYHMTYSEIERRTLKSLEDMDKAMVCTIHSFAAYILRMFPIESGVTPGFTVDEGSIFEDLFEKEWVKWLDTELSLTSNNSSTWKNVLTRIELDSIKSLTKRLSGFSIPLDTLSQKSDNSSYIHSLINPCFNTINTIIPKCQKSNNKLLLQLQELSNIFNALKTHSIDCLNNITYDFEKSISTAKTGWREEDFPIAQDTVKKCRILLKKLQCVDEPFVKTILNLILPFAKTFQQIYLSQGYVSFDGLLTLTRNLLQNDTYRRIRAALKNEYTAILVDEFQDTDPIQYDIILFLSEKIHNHSDTIHNIPLEPGKLFIVGDPKQSIYSFRRADIEAYEHVVKQICDNEAPLNLQENFRSHSGIINVVNDLFDEKIITEQQGLQPKYIPIHANRDPSHCFQKVQIISVSGINGEALTAESAREAEADWIAKWIKANVSCGNTHNTLENNFLPKLKYKDIALLLRSFTQIRPYVESLKEHNIPFIVEGEKYFYTTQEIIDFMNLLRAIENPFDTVALVGTLRSPFAGFTDNEIYLLKTNELLDYRKTISNKTGLEETINGFYAFLRNYHVRSGIIPVSRLISEIIHDPHFTGITASSWQGEQKLANLQKFYQIACKLEQIQGISLKHFINSMKQYIDDAKEEGESPLSDETLDVVKVLTIHKSKGLEFPVVILGNLHGEVKKDNETTDSAVFDWNTSSTGIALGKGEQQLRNLQSIVIENKINERAWEEEKRVLYVAMTRAKERLILTGTLKSNNKSYIGLITKSLHDAYGIELNNELHTASGQPVKVTFGVSEIFFENFKYDGTRRFVSKTEGNKWNVDWNSFVQVWNNRKQAMLKEIAQPLFISPSALCEEDTPMHYEISAHNKNGSSTEMQRKHAATIGTLCHQVLEKWDYQGTQQEFQDLINSLILININKTNTHQTIFNFIKTEIVNILTNFFHSEAYNELKNAMIIGREMPILLQWDGQIMRGTIDIIYEFEGLTIIADYKTEETHLKETSFSTHKYHTQKNIYTEAVKRCLKINNPVFKIIFLRIGKSVLI